MKNHIKSLMKIPYIKIVTIMAMLALTVTAKAQLVIGNWQNDSGDGWIDNGNGQSITNAANTNKYQFVSGVVAGYAQSLEINQAGFNQNLEIDLNSLAGGKAAFGANHLLSFTVSFPASGGLYSAGYSQIYNFTLNCAGLYTNIAWSAWTGNSGNMPGVGYYASFPGQSITVTWDYSSILTNPAIVTNLTNGSYLQLSFTSNNGGGAPTNIYMNNVVLSGFSNPSIIIDQFNPSNNPYAGTNIYAEGQITNVYGPWFGDTPTISWDATNDAQGNTNSGSLKIVNVFPGTSDPNGDQWVISDAAIGSGTGPGIEPPITNGLSLLTFEFDVMYAPNSPTYIPSPGTTNFGVLEWGVAGGPVGGYSGAGYASVSVNVTNTGWVHEVIPLNAEADSDLTNISNIFFKQDGGSYGQLMGTSTLWLDNLKFTYTNIPPVLPPPILTVQKTTRALRIFAGSTANTYDRAELATIDQYQSWIGGGSVSYSFTLLSYPTNINQTQIFLVPVNTSGQANMGNVSGSVNEYIEYEASNTLWMVINPAGTNGVTASIQWKTNTANANPSITALTITNPTVVGTWTLRFNSASTGTLTAPGASAVPFTITDPNVSTDFANPLVAYFGLQPNSTAGQGEYEDWASISVTGVAGVNENDNFTTDSSLNGSIWNINTLSTAEQISVQLATATTPYWIHWTLPAINYGLGSAMSITGNTNTSGYPWVLPEYYNDYGDGNNPPNLGQQGNAMWVLMPTNCLPTANGEMYGSGGVPANNAFFKLFNPPLQN